MCTMVSSIQKAPKSELLWPCISVRANSAVNPQPEHSTQGYAVSVKEISCSHSSMLQASPLASRNLTDAIGVSSTAAFVEW